MATWLAAAGHEVRVVTAPPYYPDWQISPAYSGPQHMHKVWQGVRVWRAPLWVPDRPFGLKRLLHLASFALGSLPLMLRQPAWRPDLVWVVEPPLFCAPTALFVARLSGARAWLHVQDQHPAPEPAVSNFENPPGRALCPRCEIKYTPPCIF